MKLKKLQRIFTSIALLIVMVTSGIGMFLAPTQWGESLFTCVWCLTMVMISDRVDEYDIHNRGESGE